MARDVVLSKWACPTCSAKKLDLLHNDEGVVECARCGCVYQLDADTTVVIKAGNRSVLKAYSPGKL